VGQGLTVWYRPLAIGLTVLILAFAAYEWWLALTVMHYGIATGGDLGIYVEAAGRLFSGGSWYLPSQLEGPHPLTMGDVLYPPTSAWFFLPFRVLGYPGLIVLWAGVMLWSLRRSEPWAWPLVALCLALPQSVLAINAGNPTLLIAVGVALALRWPVFGSLALLKPTMAPFALVGIRSRWWWVGLAGLGVLTLPFIAETLIYPQVILWTEGTPGFWYSAWHWPLALVPVLAQQRRSHVVHEVGSQVAGLTQGNRPAVDVDGVEPPGVRGARGDLAS